MRPGFDADVPALIAFPDQHAVDSNAPFDVEPASAGDRSDRMAVFQPERPYRSVVAEVDGAAAARAR